MRQNLNPVLSRLRSPTDQLPPAEAPDGAPLGFSSLTFPKKAQLCKHPLILGASRSLGHAQSAPSSFLAPSPHFLLLPQEHPIPNFLIRPFEKEMNVRLS